MGFTSLVAALEHAAQSDRGVEFMDRSDSAVRLTYRELHRRARKAGHALSALGVAAGDRVAIIMRSSPRFYDALFGTLFVGAVPVPLYPPLRLGDGGDYDRRTADMLCAAACRVVLVDELIRPLVRRAVELAAPPLGCVALNELPDRETATYAAAAADPALIQFSSGTTGQPKGALLTNAQVLANVAAIRELVLQDHPESADFRHVAVCWLPLYHDMGLIGCVFTALTHPADLVIIPPEVFIADPLVWLRAISRYRGTVSPAPNFAFALCADRASEADARALDLSSFCIALNGAEAVTAEPISRFAERFGASGFRRDSVTPVYGLSEAALIVTASPIGRAPRFELFDRERLETAGVAVPTADDPVAVRLCSVGQPVGGFALQIRDARGVILAERHLGKLWVKGPSVMRGYVGAQVRDPRDHEGWLDTGDLAFVFDGELFLYGRVDDVVIIRGRNYAPECFERAAEAAAGVRPGRCAAFGVSDDATGTEFVVLVVERSRRSSPASDAGIVERITRSVTELTAIRPRDVIVLAPGELPRTSNGKLCRRRARAGYLRERELAHSPSS